MDKYIIKSRVIHYHMEEYPKRDTIFEIVVFRLILSVICWFNIGGMFLRSLIISMENENFSILCGNLSYFTFQSNFLVAAWLIISLIFIKKENDAPIFSFFIHGAILVYITFTFIAYTFVLQPLEGFFLIDDNHYFIPIFFVIEWLYTKSKFKQKPKTGKKIKINYALFWLLYPLLYLVYILIRGLYTGNYPYPFLDLTLIGPIPFIISSTLILFALYLIGRLYISLEIKSF